MAILSSLAYQTDAYIRSEGIDESIVFQSIVRERIRCVLILFSFISECALTIVLINAFVTFSVTSNQLCLALVYFSLIGCGLRVGILRDLFSVDRRYRLPLLFTLLSIIGYCVSFFTATVFMTRTLSDSQFFIFSIASWTGLGFSLLSCFFLLVYFC